MDRVEMGEVDRVPWLDHPDYKDLISERQLAGQIDKEEAAACTFFAEEGYLIVPELIDADLLDRAWAKYEHFYEQNRQAFFESTIPDDPWPERYLNTHNCVPEIKEILEHRKILDLTDLIFGRNTRPFQTITSHKGTEQPAHSDSIHMTTEPPGYLTAAWIAFEDLEPDCGLLEYFPRSHRLPYLLSEDVGIEAGEFQEQEYDVYKRSYEPTVAALIKQNGLELRTFQAGKGDVLFWHANLLHGGSWRKDLRKSRKSLVCHYFAEGVRCYHDLSGLPAHFGGEAGVGIEPLFKHENR